MLTRIPQIQLQLPTLLCILYPSQTELVESFLLEACFYQESIASVRHVNQKVFY